MQTAGPDELGYANTALITALFDVLVIKGILTRADLGMVVTNAIEGLRPDQHISSVQGSSQFHRSRRRPRDTQTRLIIRAAHKRTLACWPNFSPIKISVWMATE